MTYKKFLSELETLGFKVSQLKKPKEKYGYLGQYIHSNIGMIYDGKDFEPALLNTWYAGGMSGGNCWGDPPSNCSVGEPEPHWNDLDTILEHFRPNLTFLEFRGMEKLFESDSYTSYEYYGNNSNYSFRILKFKKLWEYLESLRKKDV